MKQTSIQNNASNQQLLRDIRDIIIKAIYWVFFLLINTALVITVFLIVVLFVVFVMLALGLSRLQVLANIDHPNWISLINKWWDKLRKQL